MSTTASSTPPFLNRELSWLAFNARVLEEAANKANRLLERAKFASIVASNLDEFFMVRVAELKHAQAEGERRPGPCGMTPAEQLTAVSERAHELMHELYASVTGDILPALRAHGIDFKTIDRVTEHQRAALETFFHDDLLPVLTPLAIDEERPFPMLASLTVNLAFWLAPAAGQSEKRLAVVQVPPRLSRLIRLNGREGYEFVLLEDVVRLCAEALFPGQVILESSAFRLARDSEVDPDDDGRSFVEALEAELRRRRRSSVVRLEVEDSVSDGLLALLMRHVHVESDDVYRVPSPVDLRCLMSLVDLAGFPALLDPHRLSTTVLTSDEMDDIFTVLDQRDVLLHHPYESFDPVVRFVELAAADPDVLAIKQTLYRTSGDSPIVKALTSAADSGKQVTVIVELRARFDEARNILWARRLEEMGAHVIYGVRDYKVHAKACLVVRRTSQGVRRYLHLGTGNYNDRTARVYSDMGLLTSSPKFGSEVSAFFSALTGYSDPPRFSTLASAPHTLRSRLRKLIDREVRRAREGQDAEIRAKMNSLTDVEMCLALYEASRAGVRVRLNVRGICVLRPGVPGLSENITVTSIVGRYLEHARIFVFNNGGEPEVYLSSADWMTRNLDHRVELMFPVEDATCAAKVAAALDVLLRDTVKARHLDANGVWRLGSPAHDTPVDAQAFLDELAIRSAPSADDTRFQPLTGPGAGG
ncbi:MAG: polyphosphate kinase 1 [Acidobacteriota bacterium]